MKSFGIALFVFVAVCFRDASAFSGGAPTSACADLTQQHPGVTPVTCGPPCPYTVSLVAIDGSPPASTNMYRCGAQHTIQIASNSPAFRGFAIQARESTPSFSSSAAFVGEFVNPPPGANWEIWNCAAPSATHNDASDKTAVNVTWQVPGNPSNTDVTLWFAITEVFATVHAQLRGLDLSPDPAFCAPPPPAQLVFGFGQADYSDFESNSVTVEVIKRDANVGDFVVTIAPLTYSQFENMGVPLPSELPIDMRPNDPAEFELNGLQDFIEDRITVTFPQTTSTAEVVMPVTIPLINDDTNEAEEGFYLLITINTLESNPIDVASAVVLRNGVALVQITDDDELLFTFSEATYTVNEANSVIDNLVFVEKQDGRASEQILPVEVSLQLISAREPDFQLNMMAPFQLLFATTESRLPIPFNITDDNILELNEEFLLVISIPGNSPPSGYNIGTIQSAVVQILDNEVGLIGYEQRLYTADEDAGSVEVCVNLFEPANASLIDQIVAVAFFVETVDGTAIGNGQDYESLIPPGAGTDIFLAGDSPQMCQTVDIIDDDEIEDNETFTVRFDLTTLGGFMAGRFRYDPNVTQIVIIDNDAAPTTTDAPTTEPTTTEQPTTEPTTAPTTEPTTAEPTTAEPTTQPTTGPTTQSTTGPTTEQTDAPTTTAQTTVTAPTTTEMMTTTMGGDPHFSIVLPSKQLLCFSLQGEHGFVFNLISSPQLQMNALFVPDAVRSEVTWLGSLGLVIKNNAFKKSNTTKMRFVADTKTIYIGDKIKLNADAVEKLTFTDGKLQILEAERENSQKTRLEVQIDLVDLGLSFAVWFVKGNHLDMMWNSVLQQPKNSHGLIGQFFRPGVEIDKTRRLLLLPGMEPVAVMRKPVWHFMEREEKEDQLCWVAMNPGYQGKKLIEGHYLDYVVNDVLSDKFKFRPKKH